MSIFDFYFKKSEIEHRKQIDDFIDTIKKENKKPLLKEEIDTEKLEKIRDKKKSPLYEKDSINEFAYNLNLIKHYKNDEILKDEIKKIIKKLKISQTKLNFYIKNLEEDIISDEIKKMLKEIYDETLNEILNKKTDTTMKSTIMNSKIRKRNELNIYLIGIGNKYKDEPILIKNKLIKLIEDFEISQTDLKELIYDIYYDTESKYNYTVFEILKEIYYSLYKDVKEIKDKKKESKNIEIKDEKINDILIFLNEIGNIEKNNPKLIKDKIINLIDILKISQTELCEVLNRQGTKYSDTVWEILKDIYSSSYAEKYIKNGGNKKPKRILKKF